MATPASQWNQDRLFPNRTRHYGGHGDTRLGALRAADSASPPELPDQRQAVPAVVYPCVGDSQKRRRKDEWPHGSPAGSSGGIRSEEHTSELQSRQYLV